MFKAVGLLEYTVPMFTRGNHIFPPLIQGQLLNILLQKQGKHILRTILFKEL